MRQFFIFVGLAPFAASAVAQAPEPAHKAEAVCVRAEIVPGFEAFGRPTPSEPEIGKAAALTLKREDVPLPVAGPRPFKPGTFSGHYLLTVTEAGIYRVAVSQGAWISVFRAAGDARTTAHAHGPACSGIAKIVSFDLEPGIWHLALSEAKTPNVTVMVAAS